MICVEQLWMTSLNNGSHVLVLGLTSKQPFLLKFRITKGYDKWLEKSHSMYMNQSSLLPPSESARHTALKNLIEKKSKQTEAASEDLYQVGIRMVDLKKEMKMDLESKKQELGIFKIVF
ncbi:hypothetical protein LIER_42587 [Lithospermum erythrorhizon]|uniref:Uncharacterized protein n=1 Tax=Lithospermum erythrorhizon TaxID=34254 RepID=A0AAV3NM81_LITER